MAESVLARSIMTDAKSKFSGGAVRTKILYTVAICTLLTGAPAWAERCQAMAKTPLEEVFCQVQAADAQALGVTLGEFRRNPEATQRLLLRRPAQRMGLALPEPPSVPYQGGAAREPPSSSPVDSGDPPPVEPESSPQLAGCRLQGQVLMCADRRFELLGNQANSALPEGALEYTELLLPPLPDGHLTEQQLNRYLGRAYGEYIRQMAAIGLAGATMSYTRFYHTFEQSRVQELDFAQRMGQMFEFLKRDKRSLQVQAHYTQERPQSVNQCMPLDAQWVVCDDVANNWVYRRAP